jgi:undecaprenyl pyrophosphate phosphatase UppP
MSPPTRDVGQDRRVRPHVLNVLTAVTLVPAVVMGVLLTRSEPDAVYRLVAVVGVLLLVACAVPLTLAVVSTVVARHDARRAQAPAAVGLGLAVVLAILTLPSFAGHVAGWLR